MKFLLFVWLSALLIGCIATQTLYYAHYDISLKNVRTPENLKEKYGEQKVVKTDTSYFFENDVIKIIWFPNPRSIEFIIYNKTNNSIKILWDESAFLDYLGASHRIIHSGIKYTDKANSQPPTIIPRNGTVSDLIYPSDYVVWDYDEWSEGPILPYTARDKDLPSLKQRSQSFVGKDFSVLLALSITEIQNEFTFNFKIESSAITKVDTKRNTFDNSVIDRHESEIK